MLGTQEIVLILAILLLVFGPTKLPKIARELGKAWQEFNKASSSAFETLSSVDETVTENTQKTLLDVAKKLNMDTEGKTEKQLGEEILAKVINNEKVVK
ncbi:twin-arginine translocase TatA/TatE family subunit [Thermoproteota archaeon]